MLPVRDGELSPIGRQRHRLAMIVRGSAIAIAIAATTRADVLTVPGEYPTIQSAIDAASDGDRIVVAAGVYAEAIDFGGKGIDVRSAAGPNRTTIAGQIGGAPLATVTIANGEGRGSVLSGFTIDIGDAPLAIRVQDSSPTIRGNRFVGFTSSAAGAALWISLGEPLVIDNVFTGITSLGGEGGALRSYESDAVVDGNTFDGNQVGWIGGGLIGRGGAAYFEGGQPTITKNHFTGNYAPYSGGAVWLSAATPILTHNWIEGNLAGIGGGAYVSGGGEAIVANNLIIDNTAGGTCAFIAGGGISGSAGQGGGLFASGCFVAYNTIVDNDAQGGFCDPSGGIGGGAILDDSICEDCVIWGNTAAANPQVHGTSPVDYSLVEGGYPGTSNLSDSPEFIDSAEHDYRLSALSPCRDAGNPAPEWLPLHDLEGDGRRFGLIADIGADEYFSFVRGDCDVDGIITVADAVHIQALFIAAPPLECRDACDGNDDGAVDISDLIFLLNYLFIAGVEPPAPFPNCGVDASSDGVECESFDVCSGG